MTLTKATVQELDRIQNIVARFILQLPKSLAIVAGFVDGGMKPQDPGANLYVSLESSEDTGQTIGAVFQSVLDDTMDA